MKAWWSNTRPNGQPIDAGTFCRVIDLEDGTHPIFTYGATQDEVLEKIERQNGNAQLALARRSAAPPQSAPVATPVAPRARMTADEVMQAQQDVVNNPAKAGAAMSRLIEDATGVDLRQLSIQNFVRMASQWEREHPEFYPHPGNKRLLADQAKAHTGGDIARVTSEIFTQAFTELQNGGYLLEAPADFEPNPQPTPTPSPFPVESQVQRTERPRRSYSTGIPGNRLRAPQTASPRTLKYSASEIEAMPLAQSRALLERRDPDYLASVAAYEQSRMATAS